MLNVGWPVGTGQRQNPFLQIPLHAKFHVGQFGIDTGIGVGTWETMFNSQVLLLDWTDDQLGYPTSIWEMAKAWEGVNRLKVFQIHG